MQNFVQNIFQNDLSIHNFYFLCIVNKIIQKYVINFKKLLLNEELIDNDRKNKNNELSVRLS